MLFVVNSPLNVEPSLSVALAEIIVASWATTANVADGSTLLFPCREDEMPGYSRRAFTIDDFKIWNYAKTDFGF